MCGRLEAEMVRWMELL